MSREMVKDRDIRRKENIEKNRGTRMTLGNWKKDGE